MSCSFDNNDVIQTTKKLTDAQSRLQRIVGEDGLTKLSQAHIVVFGLGGVGSNCVEALARGGIGKLTLIDGDCVEPSNINRQAIAFMSTLGKRKVDVCNAMCHQINPSICINTIDQFVLARDVGNLIQSINHSCNIDYIIDCIDTVSTKLELAQVAQSFSIRLISAMGSANKLYPEHFKITDITKTVNCPLCRIMRKECRKRGIRHLRVIFSDEQPVQVDSQPAATRQDRSNLGTMSYAPPIMGQMLAADVIRTILGWNMEN